MREADNGWEYIDEKGEIDDQYRQWLYGFCQDCLNKVKTQAEKATADDPYTADADAVLSEIAFRLAEVVDLPPHEPVYIPCQGDLYDRSEFTMKTIESSAWLIDACKAARFEDLKAKDLADAIASDDWLSFVAAAHHKAAKLGLIKPLRERRRGKNEALPSETYRGKSHAQGWTRRNRRA